MVKHYRKLFEFDYWANKHVIEVLEKTSIKDMRIELLFSHMINSQQIWYSRLKGNPKGQSPWDIIPSEAFLEDLNLVNQNWVVFLDESTAKTLNETVKYKNTKDEHFKSSTQDILTHVINHSTYHRAQISAMIKSLGYTPPMTDYIAFTRERY
jgi:uncharacterized damage-inducible protein DinB